MQDDRGFRALLGATSRVFVGGLTLVSITVLATPAFANGARPAAVKASYRVSFAGVDIGSFGFQSEAVGRGYTASASAKVRLLLGALKWTGTMSGAGQNSGGEVRPRSYSQSFVSKRKLLFKTKRKSKTASLKFSGSKVVSADVTPPLKTKDRVPLRPTHLRSVLDPLGALVSLTSPIPGQNPCARRVPIFDGRQRFDLKLSPKSRKAGRGGTNHICRVRYIPIAGHRINGKDSKDIARRTSVEVTLREVNGSAILIPTSVRVPTRAGTAELTLREVNITTAAAKRIRFTN